MHEKDNSQQARHLIQINRSNRNFLTSRRQLETRRQEWQKLLFPQLQSRNNTLVDYPRLVHGYEDPVGAKFWLQKEDINKSKRTDNLLVVDERLPFEQPAT
uniref:Uncharacterized protein n=1 Tax=Ditylenchus dipsaci TaxID=166011 RepID=A0A915ELR7_9BILA